MSSQLQTYNPGDVTLLIALLYEADGFAPDSIISISRDETFFNTNKGSTGGVERTHIADNTYTLEVTLSQTSLTNSILNALATLDHTSKFSMFPIFAKDSSGQSLFLATSCWIESPPSASYTGSIETRTWTIRCAEMTFGIAGNNPDERTLDQLAQLTNLIGQFGISQGIF